MGSGILDYHMGEGELLLQRLFMKVWKGEGEK